MKSLLKYQTAVAIFWVLTQAQSVLATPPAPVGKDTSREALPSENTPMKVQNRHIAFARAICDADPGLGICNYIETEGENNFFRSQQQLVRNNSLPDYCQLKKIAPNNLKVEECRYLDALCELPAGTCYLKKAVKYFAESSDSPCSSTTTPPAYCSDLKSWNNGTKPFTDPKAIALFFDKYKNELFDGNAKQFSLPTIQDSTKVSGERSAGGAAAASVELMAVNAVKAASEFLVERAKAEISAYTVSTLGKQVCAGPTSKEQKKTLRGYLEWDNVFALKDSCAVAFTKDSSSNVTVNFDMFSDGTFQKVFAEELPKVPASLIVNAIDENGELQINDYTLSLLWLLISESYPVAQKISGKEYSSPQLLFADLYEHFKTAIKRKEGVPKKLENFKCELKWFDSETEANQPNGRQVACYTLYGLKLFASTNLSRDMESGTKPILYGDILENIVVANKEFCDDFGCSQEGSENAIVDGLDRVNEAYNLAANVLITLVHQQKILRQQKKSNQEMLQALAPYYAEVIKKVMALVEISVEMGDQIAQRSDEQKVVTKIRPVLKSVERATDMTTALLQKDTKTAVAVAKTIVFTEPISDLLKNDNINDKALRSLKLVLSLGAAQNSEEAKVAIESIAEPLGSYRGKYDGHRGRWTLSLNGFLGIQAGYTLKVAKTDLGKERNFPDSNMDPRFLTGLIGIDFSWKTGRMQHWGFMVTALDVLGFAEVESETGIDYDWGGVLTPGLMVRWGIFGSPFVLFASYQWHPLRKVEIKEEDAERPGGTARGTHSLFFGAAIDIPLITLFRS